MAPNPPNKPPPVAGAGAGAAVVAGSTGLLAGAPKEKLGGAALGVELDPVDGSAGFPKRLGVDGVVVLKDGPSEMQPRGCEEETCTYGAAALPVAGAPKRLVAGFALHLSNV